MFTGAINAVVEGEKLTITNYDGSKVSVDFSVYATDEALGLLDKRVETLEGTVASHGQSISGLSGRMTTVEGKAATAEGQLAGLTETTVMAEIAKQVEVEADRALEAEGKLAERVAPLETASADYEERIGVLESFISGGEEGESVQDLIDAAIVANNTSVVNPGLESKADKATYEAHVEAYEAYKTSNDAAVAAAQKAIEDEATRALSIEAGLQEQIGEGFSKDATVAAAVKSAQDAADAAQKTIDDFLTGEGVDPNKVDALKDIISYMEEHGDDYQAVVDNLDTLNTDVAALQGKVDVEKVSTAIAAAKEEILGVIIENEETTAAALTDLEGRVDDLEALKLSEVIAGFEGRIAANEGAVATVDSRIATAKAGAEETAAADAASKANAAEAAAKSYADGLIAAEVTRSNKYADDAVAVEAAKVAANTAAISALDTKVTEGLAWVEFE